MRVSSCLYLCIKLACSLSQLDVPIKACLLEPNDTCQVNTADAQLVFFISFDTSQNCFFLYTIFNCQTVSSWKDVFQNVSKKLRQNLGQKREKKMVMIYVVADILFIFCMIRYKNPRRQGYRCFGGSSTSLQESEGRYILSFVGSKR